MNKIEIPLSKTKLLFGISISILFVVMGVFLFTSADEKERMLFSPIIIKGIGIASILFFSAAGLYGIKKLFDKNIGLTIDDLGITDNSSAISIGLIKWSDISDIKIGQVMSTKFLLIHVKDPDSILQQVTGIKHKLMVGNLKMYGTPLAIASTILNYNFDDLEKLITDRFKAQQG